MQPKPKPSDKCKNCQHPYSDHARDVEHTNERCWHGCAVGDCCPLECKEFIQ